MLYLKFDANIFAVVYAVRHLGQSMTAHNLVEAEASLHCSILHADSCVPNTARIVVELCLAHLHTGSWLAAAAAAFAIASDIAVLADEPFAAVTEPVEPVAERIVVRSAVLAGGLCVEHEARPAAEHTPEPRPVLSFEHRIHFAIVVADVPQSLAALRCFEDLLF